MPVVGLPVAMPRSSSEGAVRGVGGPGDQVENAGITSLPGQCGPNSGPNGLPDPFVLFASTPLAVPRGNARASRPVVQHLGDAALYSAAPRPRGPAGERGAAGSVPSSTRLAELNTDERRRLRRGGTRARRGIPRRGRGPRGRGPRGRRR